MKKIGIITYHFARNYGAVLQCYALQKYLINKGYDVEVINYISKVQYNNNDYYKHGISLKNIAINICFLPFFRYRKNKNKKFDEFNNKYLKLSERISSIEELKEMCHEKKYDFIISGSDQVFNPNIEDFDFSFLLPFKTNSKKISYAASTGNATVKDIDTIKSYLDDFEEISIREKKDLSKFDKYDKKNIGVVPDPVILLSNSEWKKFTTKNNDEKYLVCYFLHKSLMTKEYEIAKQVAKEKKLKIKIINARYSKLSFKKEAILDVGPKEFINLIYNSNFVCTDSFHGTLFSLIFNKDFICFDSIENKNDSRRKNLLEELGALNRLRLVEDNKNNSVIDYKIINKNIIKKKEEADKFLEVLYEK
ncbi:MAG: polysaccharide pyruvyl transferase family protein [Clostridia bacterium]